MKSLKVILMLLIVATSSSAVKAQNLTFEETVTYIKSKLESSETDNRYSDIIVPENYSSYSTIAIGKISIENDGKIEINPIAKYFQKLNFSLSKILKIESNENIIKLYITANSFYMIQTEAQVDAERLAKAFNHLKNNLPKQKDPFDN